MRAHDFIYFDYLASNMEPTTTIQLLRTIVKSLNQHELWQLENLVVEYRLMTTECEQA